MSLPICRATLQSILSLGQPEESSQCLQHSEYAKNIYNTVYKVYNEIQSPYLFVDTSCSRDEEGTESGLILLLHLPCKLGTKAEIRASQSAYQAIVDIIKREGVLGLYSGLNSSLLGIAVTNGYVGSFILPYCYPRHLNG